MVHDMHNRILTLGLNFCEKFQKILAGFLEKFAHNLKAIFYKKGAKKVFTNKENILQISCTHDFSSLLIKKWTLPGNEIVYSPLSSISLRNLAKEMSATITEEVTEQKISEGTRSEMIFPISFLVNFKVVGSWYLSAFSQFRNGANSS